MTRESLFGRESQWDFWREWYQGFLDGNPMDWELQRRVALIDDVIWEAGPETVADEIERIRLAMRTAVAPALIRDEDNNAFRIDNDEPLASDILEYSCERIGTVLQHALAAAGSNGLREDSYETVTIRHALDKHDEQASLLATGFFDACLSLQSNIGDRYPEDTALINLQNALYAVVEEINEQHPKARERCARLASLVLAAPVTADDREEISQIPERVGGELSDKPKIILQSDVEMILSQDNPPKNVRARFTNWMATISQWMDQAMRGDKRAQWLASVVSRLVRWWSGTDGGGAA